MGGIGSGRRWQIGANDTTSDYRAIDVRRWHRDGLLTPGRSFVWQWNRDGRRIASIQALVEIGCVYLIYRHRRGDGEWKDENYPVWLDWTHCNLGGQRSWFRCPARGCGRRVAILYGGGFFACRHCYRLAYSSQREIYDVRAARRADRIREKLGWKPGIIHGKGEKPKGMHWKTFEHLTAQYDSFVNTSLTRVVERLGLSGELRGIS